MIKSKRDMIQVILSELDTWSREDLIQYVYCREWNFLESLPDETLQQQYENTLKQKHRRQDEIQN